MTLRELKAYKPNPMEWDWNDFNSLHGNQLQIAFNEQTRAMRDIHQKVIKTKERVGYALRENEAEEFRVSHDDQDFFP